MKDIITVSNIIKNPWSVLRKYTNARIGLGRTGVNIPTKRLLEFKLAHAQAQDAVHLPLDVEYVTNQLKNIKVDTSLLRDTSPFILHSQATDRTTYLQRPDLGRKLDENSHELLSKNFGTKTELYDLAIVIVDGLSSLAITENAADLIQTLTNSLTKDNQNWKLAPFTIVQQGRVAIGDEVGELLHAKAAVVLIGERPGLSSPDSLGLYFTWEPKIGLTDVSRNCISNVRPSGLSYDTAVKKLLYLLHESHRLKFSGINLKDRTTNNLIAKDNIGENFLITQESQMPTQLEIGENNK